VRHLFVPALCFILIGTAIGTADVSRTAAQQRPPSESLDRAGLDKLLESTEKLWRERKGDEAKAAFEEALEAAQKFDFERQEAQARCGIGEILFSRAQYPAAQEHGARALDIYQRLANDRGIGRAAVLLGAVAEIMGDYADAQRQSERAIAAFEAAGDRRGRALATLQLLRLPEVYRAERAVRLMERAVDDATSAGDRTLLGRALHSWGDMLFGAAQYEQALAKLTAAAAAFEAADERVDLGTVFNSIGRVYRAHGRLDEALKYQLKALELHQHADALFPLLQSLNAVGAVYQMMDDFGQAREYYQRALALAEKTSSQRIQDFLRANIAALQLQQGEFANSAATLEQVIARQLDAYGSQRYGQLSIAYLKMGRREDALAAAQRALDACGQQQADCVNALADRAAAHAALEHYSAALADLQTALDAIEDLRMKLVPTDFFKQDFHHVQEHIYSQTIALEFQQRREAAAVETAELARARAFIDLLASRNVKLSADKLQRLPLTLRGANAELPSAATAAPASIADLTASAARLDSTLILYWVAENDLYSWVISPDGLVRSHRTPLLKSKLMDLIRSTTPFAEPPQPAVNGRTLKRIATRGAVDIAIGGGMSRAWRDLYDLLIRPVRGALPSKPGSFLTIVPHGPLLNLSFAALQDSRGRYLLEDYTLHYVPAGAVLPFTAAKKRADARRGDLVLVADPPLPVLSPLEPRLPRLPGARSEVRAIARLVPRDRLTLLEGEEATEPRVRAAAARKAVVHLATHAIVRDTDPMGSYLVFARSGASAESDGLVTAREVYDLDLNAELVVLSACRSGGGRVTGDGIATFARAFIYAGTPSLVVSLWDVADEPTNRLLPAFYRSWFGGASKARSLRTAQLRLLRDLRAGNVRILTPVGSVTLPEHPVFWAGFVLVGEPD